MSQRLLCGEPVSRVEVYISCTKLKKKDILSKSDPCCLMYIQSGDQWKEVGRTEALKNNPNPQFQKPIEVDYFFEESQKIRFDVYDIDSKTMKVTDDDHLGFVEMTLAEIVASSPVTKTLTLKGKILESQITLRVEEVNKQQEILAMTFKAQRLDKKDLIGKTDSFLTFSRRQHDNWQVVLKTEVAKNDQNPTWRPLRVKASQLCGGDYDNVIKVDAYDHDSLGKHDLIGTFETNLREMIRDGSGKQWPLINPKKVQKKKDYKDSGIVILSMFELSKTSTFLDYVTAGLQIGVTIAIDFTGSNGRVTSPESLHHVGGKEPNAYMRAIEAVGNVIQEYDTDKVFPVYGFGAKIPPKMDVSHIFPINFKTNTPHCSGVRGVLDAYKTSLSHLELFGPTNFAPIINQVAKFAAAAQVERSARNYFILLILTDGVITDIQDTIHEVVAASHLPMSIIIVGIGGSDFEPLHVLDGDIEDKIAGTKSRRDIVQFVAFRDCETPASLAKHVLAEVPRQVCEYYSMYGIQPGQGVRR